MKAVSGVIAELKSSYVKEFKKNIEAAGSVEIFKEVSKKSFARSHRWLVDAQATCE